MFLSKPAAIGFLESLLRFTERVQYWPRLMWPQKFRRPGPSGWEGGRTPAIRLIRHSVAPAATFARFLVKIIGTAGK